MRYSILFVWLCIFPALQALDVGIGFRAGVEGFFHPNQIAISYNKVDSELTLTRKTYTATSFMGSLLLHLRFNSWYTLRSAFNLSLNRNIIMRIDEEDSKSNNHFLQAHHHSFETELLSQFSLGWWYLGLGASLFVTNPLTFTPASTKILPRNIPNPYNHISWGSNILMETGLNIAFNHSPHTISLALRTALDMKSLIHQSSIFAPVAVSVLLGYTYFFL